jgi:cytochrome c oxidase subunit IV
VKNVVDAGEHPQINYVFIFGALLGLTVLTVGVSRLDLGASENFALALLIAGVKVTLVAAYFMHLKFERRTLLIALGLPFILVLAFIIGLLPDIVFRAKELLP